MMMGRAVDETAGTVGRDEAEGPEPRGVVDPEDEPVADPVGSSLYHLIGSWSDAEAEETD